jgi:glycosyltransferase involved in cell wall biosynthesis
MSDPQTDVSIVIPCFNDGPLLLEALNSVLLQSFKKWEVVVVNDASTDPITIDILKGINHPQVSVHHHSNNRGLAAARNTGIRLTSTPIIFPLDADDQLSPDALEVTVRAFKESPDVDLFYAFYERFGHENQGIQFPALEDNTIVYKHYPLATSPFRRTIWERVGGFCEDPILRLGMEDVDFHYSLLEANAVFRLLPFTIYRYRTTPRSLSDRMQENNYTIRLFIANRHKQLLNSRLRQYFLQMGAIRSFRFSVARHNSKGAVLMAVRIWQHCLWPPRFWWRAIWNITNAIVHRKRIALDYQQ